ncbi:hypothetical protein [Bacillus pseudomycoides]|uniref:hypothetical protein n=1 Tax=Bacillus pseudomycoides TaxID=64104 RepID=UPI000BEDF4D8|nr:hypothetical protein [Bacillus pseudomycoides]MED4651206.1 hypothetical protein [Bacillus pseudomycoides]PEE07142.1 hypothetical protein CON86_05005 [Bacillus pseudomycoides]PEM77883.1 hypothetical protein CN632_08110 [Bacillus pseudomycoides]PHC83714.1 hypothetical protein COF63_17695 [Bacillus pseudomycoides]
MDVSYKPKDWVDMKDGLNQITKDTFVKLHQANGLLKDVQERIHDLDSDGSIYFHHKDQTETIAELHVAYTTLQKYCDDAGGVVYDHIDKPFLVTMDQFAQKMRDLSIKNFETTNRIGSTTTTTVPGSYSYGNTPQTITTTKPKITVDDIFKDSRAFDKVLHAEYEEWKRKDPNMKLEYEEYRKRVPSTRGFEYRSIEDEQKQLEAWRDFGLGVLTVGAMFICPPLGVAASLVFGGLQVKSAHDGEDWGTHRKLSQGEKVERYVSGGLDVFTGGVGGIVKGFKTLGSFGELQGEVTSFKPNAGKNMVQSLQDGKNITLDRMRLAGLKAEKYGNEKMYQLGGKMTQGMENTLAFFNKGHEIVGDGVVAGKQGGPGKVTEWVNTRHAESSKFMDGKIQGLEASLAERKLGKEVSGVAGKIDPLSNPKIAKEIEANSDAVYGYSPKQGSPLDKFGIDWTNPEEVAFAKTERMKYLKELEQKRNQLTNEVTKLQSEGMSLEEIARKKVEKRNLDRIQSYLDSNNLEGLNAMKARNRQTYGREEGPTPEQLFDKYGSWEDVIYSSTKSSPAMDVLTGLYK